ncbi:thioredoxin domain-containing protein [Candidatus Nanohalococcus occultus]|uniref:Protein-disulfide isomerase n=1 Tax=Candidatus Nanohalococcus occultus TaxID=2978047 RepID=A0ABY8CH96_9ARCH|nr:Protein-disulfide isomerase [Candidatus Nanohaloarchaeota archaeon SVXNc]
MKECDFCGDEFDSEEELHRHWREHEDELNSHQKEKVKKAERKYEESKENKMRKRKRYAGYGFAAVLGLAFIGVVGAQLMPLLNSSGSGDQVYEFDLEGEPYQGSEDANVTVVEFGDYRCPVCEQFHSRVYPRLEEEYINTGDVKFYFINFAFLDQNFPGDTSETAAVASECVYNQDEEQFWDFYDALYNNQGSENEDWATEDFMSELFNQSTSGLDHNQFQTCVANKQTLQEVRQDTRMGRSSGVTGTPSIYVNGDKLSSWGYNTVARAIEEELRQ